MLDRAIASASRAQSSIGLVLSVVHTRLGEPPARALAAKGTRFAVREGLLLRAQKELDTAFGAIGRLDVVIDMHCLQQAAVRIKQVLTYNDARDACVALLKLDGIDIAIPADALQGTLVILRRLLSLESPGHRTGFAYVDTIEVAVDAAIEQGCGWSVARYLDALAAELEGIEH